MELLSKIERDTFNVFLRKVNTLYLNFEQRLSDHIAGQLALGRSQKDVLTELTDNLNDGKAIFNELLSGVEREMDWGLNAEYQASSNAYPGGSLVKWTLDPAAEHCDSCLAQAALPARDITTIPIPGTQPTVGEKNCGPYCRCTLEPIELAQAA